MCYQLMSHILSLLMNNIELLISTQYSTFFLLQYHLSLLHLIIPHDTTHILFSSLYSFFFPSRLIVHTHTPFLSLQMEEDSSGSGWWCRTLSLGGVPEGWTPPPSPSAILSIPFVILRRELRSQVKRV